MAENKMGGSSRELTGGPAVDAQVAPTSHVLTVAPPEAGAACGAAPGSDGQGELLRSLSKTPIARAVILAEHQRRGRGRFDTAHLGRYDGTNYCQWMGRASDGYFHAFGPIFEIVERATAATLGGFCPACQAIPTRGYCSLPDCPMPPPDGASRSATGDGPFAERLNPNTAAEPVLPEAPKVKRRVSA
jgi:hypothetical protein